MARPEFAARSPPAKSCRVYTSHLGSSTEITGAGTSVIHQLAYVIDSNAEAPFFLPQEADAAPPVALVGLRLGIGVAVADGVAVVASQSFATGWSLAARRRLWTTQLGGTYPRGDVPDPSRGSASSAAG